MCLQNARDDNFGIPGFACQLPGDQCESDEDCYPDFCSIAAMGRTCRLGSVCGRPFLVDQAPRVAAAIRSDAWLDWGDAASARPAPKPALALRLAEHWTKIALMEHASVAAFARFTLQLLALGAPADLVEAATRAQAEETRHATLAFGLAASYGGSPVGPGPLDLAGALGDTSAESVLRTTIREGCIGETRAALEAAAAAREATAPHVKAALESISADEASHAAIAWRVVQWILREHPRLVPVARDELARAADVHEVASRAGSEDHEAASHGLLNDEALARVHRSAAREVILPCAHELLALYPALRRQGTPADGPTLPLDAQVRI